MTIPVSAISRQWLSGSSKIDASPFIVDMLAQNDDKDAYLRHAGVMALTSILRQPASEAISLDGPLGNINSLVKHDSPAVRLAVAVALRRLESPHAAKLLLDADPRVAAEAAHAIFDDPAITAAYPALADVIRVTPAATPPAARRSIAANRYLADEESALRLSAFAASEDVAPDLRIAALEALASWTEATNTNPVDGRHDPMKASDPEIAKAAYLPFFATLRHSPHKDIAKAAAAVSKNLGIVARPSDLVGEALNTEMDTEIRIRSLEELEAADPELFAKTLPGLLNDGTPGIRSSAAALLLKTDPAAVSEYAKQVIMKSTDVPERQNAVLLLGKIKDPAARSLLAALVAKTEDNPEIQLELSEAFDGPAKTHSSTSASLVGGDPALGEIVFNGHPSAQCTACHRLGDEGSEVGPPLNAVGEKGREYILESLLQPQAEITPGYGLMSLQTKAGVSIAGALKEETEELLTLILPDKTETDVKVSEIASRTDPLSTMPPMGAILSPRELRDLVAFLAEQK